MLGKKTGGRKAGTPNKNKTIKMYLREHSLEYFTPNIEDINSEGKKTGRLVSQYEIDLRNIKTSDRVNAELALLKFHTPQMQATNVDIAMSEENHTLSERLAALDNGEDIASTSE